MHGNISELSYLASNVSSNQTTKPSLVLFPNSSSLMETLMILAFIVILVVGLIGNTFNMLVFGKKKMRKISTFRYLFYLSISDLLVLAIGASDILIKKIFLSEIRTQSQIVCKLHTFFTYFLTHVSSLILMAVSIDRAIIMSNTVILSEAAAPPISINTPKKESIDIVPVNKQISTPGARNDSIEFNSKGLIDAENRTNLSKEFSQLLENTESVSSHHNQTWVMQINNLKTKCQCIWIIINNGIKIRKCLESNANSMQSLSYLNSK